MEQNERIEQIHGVPLVIKGIDINRYSQQTCKPSASPLSIPKKFKMPTNLKYDGTLDLHDHVDYMTRINGNDLTKEKIEFVLIKKFTETLTKRISNLVLSLTEKLH